MKFLENFKEVSQYTYLMILCKLQKSDMSSLNYIESFSLKSPDVCKLNGKQNTTFQFSVMPISNKMHEATFKLDLTQRLYVDR